MTNNTNNRPTGYVPDPRLPDLAQDLNALLGLPLTKVEISDVAFGIRLTFNECVEVTFTTEGVHTAFDPTKIDKLPGYFNKYLARLSGGIQ